MFTSACCFLCVCPLTVFGRVSHLAQESSHETNSTLKSVSSAEISLSGKGPSVNMFLVL